MRVCLVGPTSPAVVSDRLDAADGTRSAAEPVEGTLVAEIARGFLDLGHEVRIVSLGRSDDEFSGPGLRLRTVVRRRPRDYLSDLYSRERRALAAAVHEFAPDIVHAHWTYEYELAAQLLGEHVTTAHDSPLEIARTSPDAYRIGRLLVALRARPGIDRLSSVSDRLASSWRHGLAYRAPIQVIPNPVPGAVIPARRSPADQPMVLEVANAGRHKNVKGLLAAFSLIRGVIPEALLVLVGPGLHEGSQVHAWARARGLDLGVCFRGALPVPDLRREYERAWVLGHAARVESFGLAVGESLAAGLPVVIGARTGPFPALMYEGVGSVVDTSRASMLARALMPYLSEGPKSIPREHQTWFRTEFAATAIAQRYLAWYERP